MWDLFVRALPLLAEGIVVTIFLGTTSFALGSAIGLLVALARLSGIAPLTAFAVAYLSIFRGTPMLVQILLIYFGLPQLGISLDPIPSAIIALSLGVASYQSENFRSGILGVEKGQREAAFSIGMTSWQALRRIIFPQALRIATPTIGNRFIALMKDTSLASVVTVVELTRVAERIGSATFRYLEMFVIIAAIYWGISTVLSIGQETLERRMARAF
ncbi:MAG: amino acid ABC transporter permease [Chloroflexi bacterium]|nr:amino acid ABC transporter permease [Chloroflexota bacterium]